MSVHDEIERAGLERQVTTILVEGLQHVVGCAFDLDDVDAERSKSFTRYRHVRSPRLRRHGVGRSKRQRGQPLAATGSHVEHVLSDTSPIGNDRREVPRQRLGLEAVAEPREVPPTSRVSIRCFEKLGKRGYGDPPAVIDSRLSARTA